MKGLVLLILVTDIDTYIRVYYYVGAVHDPENILMRKECLTGLRFCYSPYYSPSFLLTLVIELNYLCNISEHSIQSIKDK